MRSIRRWILVASLVAVAAGCGLVGGGSPSPQPLPEPTCGGAKVAIPGALPCAELARLAIEVLRKEAPQQLARGIIAIDVNLQGCPANEVPPQLDCTGEAFVQLVTITFSPPVDGGPVEPSLAVGLDPTSGRVLGIVNPLVR
jgi:hypothetical protein